MVTSARRPRAAAAVNATPAPPSALAPRRFRAHEVAEHLDMATLGELWLGVGLAGWRSLAAEVLADRSGTRARLLQALSADPPAPPEQLKPLAHAVKGTAASMGLEGLRRLALGVEQQALAGTADATACREAATALAAEVHTLQALLTRMGLVA